MTEIVVRTGSGLDITRDQEMWSDRQLAALRQLGLQDASNADLAIFLHQSQRTGLDPFARQIYMIKRFTKDGPRQTIQTGIDGFRLVARRAADARGETIGYEPTHWADAQGVWRDVWLEEGPPAAAMVVVRRNGEPFHGVAMWREYAQFNKNGELTQMWGSKPALMLAKCAEALALRRAFPQDLAGLNTDDEMGNDDPQPTQRRVTAKVIRGETEPQPEPDPVTGELPIDQPEPTDQAVEWPPAAQPGGQP